MENKSVKKSDTNKVVKARKKVRSSEEILDKKKKTTTKKRVATEKKSTDNVKAKKVSKPISGNKINSVDNGLSFEKIMPKQHREKVCEEKERIKDKDVRIYPISRKKHISFEARIGLMISAIIFTFFVAFLFIFQAFNYKSMNDINYYEKGFTNYQVCLKQDANYQNSCLAEGGEYLTEATDILNTSFEYKALYAEAITYQYNYYVIAKVNILDKNNNDNLLYSTEDVLVERTKVEGENKNIDFSVNARVPFAEYYEYVNSYNMKYGVNTSASVEVSLYIDDENTGRKVASLTASLSDGTFMINKDAINNNNQIATIIDDEWNNYNAVYATFGVLFVLIGLCILSHMTALICKTISTESVYQKKLNQILKEYDRFIVISRGEYKLNEEMRVIKVPSFKELMDARNTLEKPIVYVKVNNVKSEFYVEDGNIVYLYVMKEADLEEE